MTVILTRKLNDGTAVYRLEEGMGISAEPEKAPLLEAYQQAYLPKQPDHPSQGPLQRPSFRGRPSLQLFLRRGVPAWTDVLLTALLMWLAAAGFVLIIAMVRVGMYQPPGGMTGNSGQGRETRDAGAFPALAPLSSADISSSASLYPDAAIKQTAHRAADRVDGHSNITEDDRDDDEGDDDDDSDGYINHHDHDNNDEDDKTQPRHGVISKGYDHDEDDKDHDGEEDRHKVDEGADGRLGRKPWHRKKHHHHKKHRHQKKRGCMEDERSCDDDSSPRW